MAKYLDITGKRYGRLIAKEFVYRDGTMYFWRFVCDCGIEKVLLKPSVLRGHTKSCGCFNNEKRSERFTKHGYAKDNKHHPLYATWMGMRRRCNGNTLSGYHRYGGRGIKVCERWDKFENFLQDMEKSWIEHITIHGKRQTSIERINNDGNYEPKNCKWATWKEQANNKKNGWELRRQKQLITN